MRVYFVGKCHHIILKKLIPSVFLFTSTNILVMHIVTKITIIKLRKIEKKTILKITTCEKNNYHNICCKTI